MTDLIDNAKEAAGKEALKFVKPGMNIGLGTGSTTAYFIEALGKSDLKVFALATSKNSEAAAKRWGIPLLDPSNISSLDLTVDGADEIDLKWRMIKGGGGALLREKITASISKQMIVIVDETKVVKSLGKHSLPVEILPWGKEGTKRSIENLGFKGKFRPQYLTDNQNLIFDISFESPLVNPESTQNQLLNIPGILATGLFFNLASMVLVGYGDGSAQSLEKNYDY